ncbi:MAG: ketopantoate reductase C-terminal domain-containing protein [Pseudomonadota bacterium]
MLTFAGAGAVGITLASHLATAGKPVRLYARDKDQAAFTAAGQLKLDRPRGGALTATLPPLTPRLFDTDTRYLVIATKFGALDALLGQLQDAPPTLTVVSTLNGVRALPLIRQRLPQCKAMALTIMFNAQHSGTLHAQLTTKPAVILADGDAGLKALLAGSGLAVSYSQGEQACWGKLLINLANAIGALTQSTFRDLLSDPDLRAIFVAVLDEAVDRIEAAKIDYKLPMPLPYRGYRALLKYGGGATWWLAQIKNGLDDGAYPSMVGDVRAGRATEVQQLNGEIVALGAQQNWPAPVNAALVQMVEALNLNNPARLTPAELRTRLKV